MLKTAVGVALGIAFFVGGCIAVLVAVNAFQSSARNNLEQSAARDFLPAADRFLSLAEAAAPKQEFGSTITNQDRYDPEKVKAALDAYAAIPPAPTLDAGRFRDWYLDAYGACQSVQDALKSSATPGAFEAAMTKAAASVARLRGYHGLY